MISEHEYLTARNQKEEAQKIIDQYHKEQSDEFEKRLSNNPIFKNEELLYSAYTLCPCGHGLAYPKNCNFNHYWDCSAILKGIADKNVQHTAQLPFAFYDIKAESEHRGTTRGIYKPKKEKEGEKIG